MGMALIEFYIGTKFSIEGKNAGVGGCNIVFAPTPAHIWVPWSLVVLVSIYFAFHLRFKEGATTLTTGNEFYQDPKDLLDENSFTPMGLEGEVNENGEVLTWTTPGKETEGK